MKKLVQKENVFKTRPLVVMAMLTALHFVLSQFNIYLTPTFRLVSFSFIPGAIAAILYGPVAGLAFGFVADTVGYIAKPMGPYFIGYAVSAMATNFIYASFLYKKPLQLWRVALAQLLVLGITVFGLNYLWNLIMYGSVASKYYTSVRILNNLLQYPLHVGLVLVFGKFASRLESGISRKLTI